MDGGNALLVQHMGLSPAVKPGNARQPGVVAKLVHIGGIHGVHGLAVPLAQFIGQHNAQLCRVIGAALVRGGIFYQFPVDFHDPGSLGIGAAAPAYEYVHVRRGHAVMRQKIHNHLHPHGQLIVGGGIFQQLRGIVEDGLGVDVFLVLKIAHLGGGGAGVDYQQFHSITLSHISLYSPFAIRSARSVRYIQRSSFASSWDSS